MKKGMTLLSIGVVLVLTIWAVFFHAKKDATQTATTIVLGSQGTDTAVWRHIASSEAAKKTGLKIEVKDFTDSAALNRALADNAIQANAFQSYAYYVTYNKANPKNQVYALGTSYIQPMGLYSQNYHTIDQIPNHATIAIANDPAAESRGLKLLESAGLITLKPHAVDDLVSPNDIIDNPKSLNIKPVVSTTTPALLHDQGVAAVAIDNNTAQQAKLNVFKDAIFHEKLDQNTRANVNVIVTNKQHRHDKQYQKLVTLYHEPTIQKWLKQYYPGKMSAEKPLSALTK
ncbi:metal ABC transporter substrate-binding protein [Leuconostoc lactis]|uniref:MetQ/NlpA family ABC transporter substrate-binding protein n=1 Tax=Leuconostoc lactis TaxID=1246 RepID=UPI0015F43D00|nr:MetQ/NlpA family ABC transporter substrate-binding protein [Leuconostoc lactis]MBA5813384.1 metal ABC transporter substrate-binding protein [Leuconostoc lactis]